MFIAPATVAPVRSPTLPGASVPAAPAAPALTAPAPTRPASAPATSAVEGVEALRAPLIDFPGVGAGDSYAIVKGSRAGFLGGIRGEASIVRFDDESAAFHVRAGKLGMKVEVDVEVARVDDSTVRISSRGSGIPDTTALGEVVESRRDYAEFRAVDLDVANTIIQRADDTGVITVDTEVPGFGEVRLVLEPRPA